jgi:hypothetical protein
MFGACEEWQSRLVSDGGIIERKRAGKKSVARDAMRVRRMNAAENRQC